MERCADNECSKVSQLAKSGFFRYTKKALEKQGQDGFAPGLEWSEWTTKPVKVRSGAEGVNLNGQPIANREM
jgi:hypothetical protein